MRSGCCCVAVVAEERMKVNGNNVWLFLCFEMLLRQMMNFLLQNVRWMSSRVVEVEKFGLMSSLFVGRWDIQRGNWIILVWLNFVVGTIDCPVVWIFAMHAGGMSAPQSSHTTVGIKIWFWWTFKWSCSCWWVSSCNSCPLRVSPFNLSTKLLRVGYCWFNHNVS